MSPLSAVERLKLRLLADGMSISANARSYMDAANHKRSLTSADYASTSGVILCLPGDVWVNSPIASHNPNFVQEPALTLDLGDDGLVVRGEGEEVPAAFWLAPTYHDEVNDAGVAYTSYAFTHTDRVRISPIEGCAFTCRFCDLPYEFRYRRKDVDGLVEAVRRARDDPTQPAAHCLISGGTPRPEDYDYLSSCYEGVVGAFPGFPVDVMMVPLPGVLDPDRLLAIGVNEISVNLEIVDRGIAKRYMRRKYDQGLDWYLEYLERAATTFGPGRVRSMLMAGLEPMEYTLAGVRALAERGCVPVLSPFRPDQSTPLRDHQPPTAAFLEQLYLRAHEITSRHGVSLGPSCIPCSHNTLSFASSGHGDARHHHGRPCVV